MISVKRPYYFLYFGLIIGLAFVLYNELGYSIKFFSGFLSFVLGGLMHYFLLNYALNYFKLHFAQGEMFFRELFSKGFSLSIIAGIIASVVNYFSLNLRPALIQKLKIQAEEGFLESGMSEEMLDSVLLFNQKFYTPFWLSFFFFIFIIFGSLFISLLVSRRIRTKINPLQEK